MDQVSSEYSEIDELAILIESYKIKCPEYVK